MADLKETDSFRLPAPSFGDETKKSIDSFTKLRNPHFSTPSGMLLPREKQPPPMYGPRGSTVPPWLVSRGYHQNQNQKRSSGRGPPNSQQHRFRGPPRGHFNTAGYDKEIIPELLEVDWNLWCEKCDFNCKTEAELQKHLSEHQACKVEGCKYVGHPRAMKRHWRLAHDEQRQQEKALLESKQTPEEIEKWRMERRMRYPSKANVLRRMKEQEEKFKRGERIEEDKKRFPNNRPSDPPKAKITRNSRKSRQRKNKTDEVQETVVKDDDESDDDDVKSRISFKGTSQLKDYKEKPKTSLSLLCTYGSDSEQNSEEDEPTSKPAPDNKVSSPRTNVSSEPSPGKVPVPVDLSEGEILDSDESEEVMADDEKQDPEESAIAVDVCDDVPELIDSIDAVKDDPSNESKNKKSRSRKRRSNAVQNGPSTEATASKHAKTDKPLLDYRKLRHARQNTLLEKLLEPDIRHERNVLLQCVRFVVENRFFGIGQLKTSNNDDEIVHKEK